MGGLLGSMRGHACFFFRFRCDCCAQLSLWPQVLDFWRRMFVRDEKKRSSI